MKLSSAEPPWRIVVVAIAAAAADGVPAAVAGRLAAAAGLRLHRIRAPQNPRESLAQLVQEGNGSLAALPIDVGLPLPEGGSWAEALGAWRQPTLLVLSGEQMATGLPAATTALLGQWGVPLLGLVQAGGRWRAGERRRDGLPWLGPLPAPREDSEPAGAEGSTDRGSEDGGPEDGGSEQVLELLRRRWRALLELPIAA